MESIVQRKYLKTPWDISKHKYEQKMPKKWYFRLIYVENALKMRKKSKKKPFSSIFDGQL